MALGAAGGQETASRPNAASASTKPAIREWWAPGKYSVAVKSTAKQSGRRGGPGGEKDVASTHESEKRYELTVEPPAAGGQKLRIVFARLMSQGTPPDTSGYRDYDTDKPAGDGRYMPQYRFKEIIGVPLEVSVDGNGALGKLSGIDEVTKKTREADDTAGVQTLEAMSGAFVNEAVAALRFEYPPEPVAKGRTWKQNLAKPMSPAGAIQVATEHRVKSVEDTAEGKIAEIEFSARSTTDKPKARNEDEAKFAQIAPIDKITYEAAGTLRVNLSTRMLSSSKTHTKSNVKGTVLMEGKATFDISTEGDTEVMVTPVKQQK